MYAQTMPDRALNKAVAAELNDLRQERGFSQETLADMAGIPRVSLQRYLTGTRSIRLDDLAVLANVLGDDPLSVFTRATARVQRKD